MYNEPDFEDIRPYHNHEINPALKRIMVEPAFDKILDFFFEAQDKALIRQRLTETFSSDEFQRSFMYPLVNSIITKTSLGLSSSGFEQLTPGKPYLFIANHRDIVLDSAILQVLLLDYGLDTTEITFGSNLMINQFVIDLGKVNRMFKVERRGNKIELLKNADKLSAYLRHTITKKKSSVWIAQRPGRTKDGNDKTETGLLKMLNMSGKREFRDSFEELNMVPLSVSYEYEPCCALKSDEVLKTVSTGTYFKKPNEDLVSILTGITQQKGRIHLSVGTPLNDLLHRTDSQEGLKNKINELAEIIDSEIYRNFRLWPNNYIAHDLLYQSLKYEKMYTTNEREEFLNYMEREISSSHDKKNPLQEFFLGIYANPVINKTRIK